MVSKKDILIMSNLRSNARISLTNLSKKTKIPISTLFDRLRTQEKEYIVKHTALLDFTKLGYSTRAHIIIKVAKSDREGMREHLSKHQNVNSFYKINNGFDFMVEGIFKHIKEMEDFLENLDERYDIIDRRSYYIIDEIKREEFLSDEHKLGLI